jgi:hypothetical protein
VTGNRWWRRQRGHSLRRALVCCPSPRRRGEGGQRPDEGRCLATRSEHFWRMPAVDAIGEPIVDARPLTPSGSWSSDKCCPSCDPLARATPSCRTSLSPLAGRGATNRRWAPCDARETHVGPRGASRGKSGQQPPSAASRGAVTGNRWWRRQRGHSLRRALVCCPSLRGRGEGGQRPDEGRCLATRSELSWRMPAVAARAGPRRGRTSPHPSGSWSSDKRCTRLTLLARATNRRLLAWSAVTGNRWWRRQRVHSLRRALVCCPSPRRRGEGGQRPDEGRCLATRSELSWRMPAVAARAGPRRGRTSPHPSGSWSSHTSCTRLTDPSSGNAQLPESLSPLAGRGATNLLMTRRVWVR